MVPMEIPRFSSSALRFSGVRSQQIIASPLYTVKQLGANSNYPSFKFSQLSPYSPIPFFCRKSCPEILTNGTHLLKPVPLQAHGQQAEGKFLAEATKNDVMWSFMRPFPVIFTLIQFSSMLARRMIENPHVFQQTNWSILMKILAVIASQSCANVYATGINQIFDIEIDKINKPYLPLCSGQLPVESAWLLVMGFVAISLLIAGTLNCVPFLASIFCLLLVHSLYSIPPLRAKTSTIGAPIAQSMMNGSVQFCTTFAGVGAVLGLPFQMSFPAVFMLVFSSIFGFSMGIMKDLPDIEGDRANNIPTIATIVGARKALRTSLGICILNHLGGFLIAIIRPETFKSWIMIPAHILSIFFMLYKVWKLEQVNYEENQSFDTYVTFWGLYFIHLFLFPFI